MRLAMPNVVLPILNFQRGSDALALWAHSAHVLKWLEKQNILGNDDDDLDLDETNNVLVVGHAEPTAALQGERATLGKEKKDVAPVLQQLLHFLTGTALLGSSLCAATVSVKASFVAEIHAWAASKQLEVRRDAAIESNAKAARANEYLISRLPSLLEFACSLKDQTISAASVSFNLLKALLVEAQQLRERHLHETLETFQSRLFDCVFIPVLVKTPSISALLNMVGVLAFEYLLKSPRPQVIMNLVSTRCASQDLEAYWSRLSSTCTYDEFGNAHFIIFVDKISSHTGSGGYVVQRRDHPILLLLELRCLALSRLSVTNPEFGTVPGVRVIAHQVASFPYLFSHLTAMATGRGRNRVLRLVIRPLLKDTMLP